MGCWASLLCLCLASHAISLRPTLGTTHHVPSVYATIQAGIDAASDGDTVLIADGTYTGPGNHDIDFAGKHIVVRSINGPGRTIIDCEGSSTEPHRGFRFISTEDGSSVLMALTIRGGFAPFDGPSDESFGGGVYCTGGSSPSIVDCIITGNRAADAGGGVYCGEASSVLILRCSITYNTCINRYDLPIGGLGGGMRCSQADPVIRQTIFFANIGNVGAGISCFESTPTLDSCIFEDNRAQGRVAFEPIDPGFGGAVHLFLSDATLRYCTFVGNVASHLGAFPAGGCGGAVAMFFCSPQFFHCTFDRNTARRHSEKYRGLGGAIFSVRSSPVIRFSIIAGSKDGEAVFCSDALSLPVLSCTNVYGNVGGNWIDCIAEQGEVSGNLSVDPFFCDPGGGDYRIAATSLCAPANNSCGSLIGAHGIGCEGFLVGDVDGNGELNVSDVVHLASYLYGGGTSPDPTWTGDTSCDGRITLLDVVILVNHVLRNGPRPECD